MKNDSIPPSATEMDLLILLSNNTLYGLQIIEAIKTASEGIKTLKIGSLYTTLHRMEQKNLVVSKWGDEEQDGKGARRKYYTISKSGEIILQAMKAYRKNLSEYKIFEDLRGWLRGIFTSDWLLPKEVLKDWQISLANTTGKGLRLRGENLNSTIERVKVFEWEDKSQSCKLALLLALTPNTNSIDVHIRLYPLNSQSYINKAFIKSSSNNEDNFYLPPNLKLQLIESSGKLLKEISSSEDYQDDCIQLPIFECDFGESFTCKIKFSDIFITSEGFLV